MSPSSNFKKSHFILLLIITLILLTAPTSKTQAQILRLTIYYNGEIYGLSDNVTISGNLTLDGNPVENALVAIQVMDPSKLYFTCRTAVTGPTPPTVHPVNFTYLYPSDSNGQPKYTFKIGDSLCITYSIRNHDNIPHYVTIAISLYDPQEVPIGTWLPAVTRLDPGSSSTTIFFAAQITSEFAFGTYKIYGNLYSDLPSNFGIPYCPEKMATFSISSTSGKISNIKYSETTEIPQTGTYMISFKLPKVGRIGTYYVYASTSYAGLNSYSSMTIPVMLIGDVNDDKWVELMDFFFMSMAFGSTPESPNWNEKCDIYPWPEGDDYIELMDFWLISLHFGDHVLGY